MQFYDGTQLAVIPSDQGGGITYTQTNGSSTHFTPKDELPTIVREKFSQIPTVMKYLHANTDPLKVRNMPNSRTTTTTNHPMKHFR